MSKHPGGRPSLYKPEYAEQAYKLCLLGATDKDMADFFGVSEQTLNSWKEKYPKFLESLKNGKERADAEIAQKLYHRAKGYEHPEDKIFNDNSTPLIVPTIKHYPPDTTAAIFWLKNRQPDKWRDVQKVESQNTNTNVNIDATAQELLNNPEIAQKAKDGTLTITDVQKYIKYRL